MTADPCDCVEPVTSSFLGANKDCGRCGGTGRVLPSQPKVEPSAGRGRVVFEALAHSLHNGVGYKGDRQGMADLVAYVSRLVEEHGVLEGKARGIASAIQKLEDGEEDVRELATRARGTDSEPLTLGLEIVIKQALESLRG